MNEYKIKASASKIKAKLAAKGYFIIKDAALAIDKDPDVVSQTINYLRENKDVRIALAGLIGAPVEKVFDMSIECVPARFREKVA